MSDQNGSSGLGLAICKKILDIYGGRIWFESRSGTGTEFFFTLPQKSEEANETPGKSAIATVLLVDDAESDIELAQIMMLECELLSCNLLAARNGEEAVRILDRSVLTGETIDLVLLDINMPGMDGFEVLEHIRSSEKLKDTPVVMCTGSSYSRDRQRAKDLTVSGYLVKPPSFEKLQPIIEEIASLGLRQIDGRNILARV